MDAAVLDVVRGLCEEVEAQALRFQLPDGAAVVAWDTETTGLQGVVVQLGVVVLDAERVELAAQSRLFAPLPGFPIEPTAFRVHKISQSRQEREGEPVASCLRAFAALADCARRRGVPLVAHNAAFDKRMLRNTATAAQCAVSVPDTECTMQLGKRVYRGPDGRCKRPRNRDLYELLVGDAAPEEAQLHDAVADARLTAHSFLEGRARGLW